MDLAEQLRTIGLNKAEIKVYLYLLEYGLSSPAQVAKGVKSIKTNTYNVLNALRDKDLIERRVHGKRFLYAANDPQALVTRLEQEKQAAEKVLPDLRALYKVQKNKPVTRYYYGIEGIKEIFARFDGAKSVLFILSTEKLFAADPIFFEKLRAEVVRQNIFIRDIITRDAGEKFAPAAKEAMKGYYDYRFLDKQYADLPTGIRIWNDNVALVTLEDPLFGIVLTDPHLAETFRVMFETMWEKSSEV